MATNNGDILITIREEHTGVSQQYVDGKVAQEATARQEADTAVTAAMTALVEAETNARTSAVNAEATARETADSALSARITDNANGIQANANSIASEAATRASEDARIEAAIASNEQATAATIRGINSTISANDTASRERDNALDSKIDAKEAECVARVAAERQAREASEALIRSYVDAKTTGALHYKGTVATVAYLPQTGQVTGDMYNVQADGQNYAWDGTRWDSMGALIDLDPLWAGINANRSAISEEAIARQSADSTLQSNINTEASNRQSGDATLQSNIEAEATARQSADATLQNNITAENTRATSAEGTLNNAIATESTTRQQADASLQSAIAAEAARATGKEAEIANPVVKELYLVGADASKSYIIRARNYNSKYNLYLREEGSNTNIAAAENINSSEITEIVALTSKDNSGVSGFALIDPSRITTASDYVNYAYNGNFTELSYNLALRDYLSNAITSFMALTPSTSTTGVIALNGNIIENNDYYVKEYTVAEGDALLIHAVIPSSAASNRALVSTYDANGRIIDVLYTSATKNLMSYYIVEQGVASLKVYYYKKYDEECFVRKVSAGLYESIRGNVVSLRETQRELDSINQKNAVALEDGSYYPTSVGSALPDAESNANMACKVVSVSKGDRIEYYLKSGVSAKCISKVKGDTVIGLSTEPASTEVHGSVTCNGTFDKVVINTTNSIAYRVAKYKPVDNRVSNLEETVARLDEKDTVQLGVTYQSGYLQADGLTVDSSNTRGYSNWISVAGMSTATVVDAVGVYNSGYYCIFLYDSSKTLIDKVKGSSSPQTFNVGIPNNAAYIRVNCNIDSPAAVSTPINIAGNFAFAVGQYLDRMYSSPNYGKSIAVFGGSFSVIPASNTAKDYWRQKLGLTITNYGVSGAGFRKSTSESNNIMCQVDRAIASGNTYGIWLLWASTNDFWGGANYIGDETYYVNPDFTVTYQDGDTDEHGVDILDTQCGGMNYCIYRILNYQPTAKILVFTSIRAMSTLDDKGYNPSSSAAGSLAKFVDGQIAVAERWGIPYLNQFKEFDINPLTMATYMTQDNLHPNKTGYNYFKERQVSFLATR